MFTTALALLAALVVSGPIAGRAGDGHVGDSRVEGTPRSVQLGSVQSLVAARALATPDPAQVLRRDLERGLDAIDWKREGIHGRFEILAVLSDAESQTARGGSKASCTIRATVRGPGGNLLAVVRGSARGEDAPNARAALERDVISAAARRATASIPEAIRRARGAPAR